MIEICFLLGQFSVLRYHEGSHSRTYRSNVVLDFMLVDLYDIFFTVVSLLKELAFYILDFAVRKTESTSMELKAE